MEIKIVCGTLCLVTVLLLVLILTRKREGFVSFDTKLTVVDSTIPSEANPDTKQSTTYKVDMSGNGAIPVSISNLEELAAASPTSLKGKNLPKTIDDQTTVSANKMKIDSDAMAEMRRIARKEVQDARRFDTAVIDDEESAEEDSSDPRSRRCRGCEESPCLLQGENYSKSSNNSSC